jgi:hypothetical protein
MMEDGEHDFLASSFDGLHNIDIFGKRIHILNGILF